MTLPRRRRSRPKGAARLAPVPGIPASSEADTDVLEHVKPADWDGTTIDFTVGASGTGLPDPEPAARPPAMLRTQPPPFSRTGYDATTGPMPALAARHHHRRRPHPRRPLGTQAHPAAVRALRNPAARPRQHPRADPDHRARQLARRPRRVAVRRGLDPHLPRLPAGRGVEGPPGAARAAPVRPALRPARRSALGRRRPGRVPVHLPRRGRRRRRHARVGRPPRLRPQRSPGGDRDDRARSTIARPSGCWKPCRDSSDQVLIPEWIARAQVHATLALTAATVDLDDGDAWQPLVAS